MSSPCDPQADRSAGQRRIGRSWSARIRNYGNCPRLTNSAMILIGCDKLEHRHFRPAPLQYALAVTQASVDIEMPPLNGIITVRIFAAAVLVEASADAAGRKLPAMRVPREHALPGVLQQFFCFGRFVVWSG